MKKLLEKIGLLVAFVWLGQLAKAQDYRSVEEAHGLEVGMKAPLFMATDQTGVTFSLEKALESGPVVLIFYRGQWCPYCNKHLSNLQDSLQLIVDRGATVVAVSPEKSEYAEKSVEKTGASFSLLYDDGYKISDAYDLTFLPTNKQTLIYNSLLGADMKNSHPDGSEKLPIPATYIIDQNGLIKWRQFDPDYKKRSTVEEIIRNL